MRSHVDQSQNHVFDQTWMNENVVNINMSVLTKAVIRSTRIKLHFCSESKFSTYLSGISYSSSSSVLAHKASGHRFESYWWSGAEIWNLLLGLKAGSFCFLERILATTLQ